MLPLLLIFIAILSAAVAVYGTLPQWILYHHGMQIIEMTRRLQWPLLTLSVLLCLGVMVLVISGKRRIWWLLGLAPVLALLSQQFVTGRISSLKVIEQPPTVSVTEASFLSDDEYVVGMQFNEQWYAFPFRQLYHCPVIINSEREKRMILMWSPFANRAMAFHVKRQIKAREMNVVSMPANAMLVYNGRVGEFINAVTGLTPEGAVPNGFMGHIATVKTPWGIWRRLHPQSKVMSLPTLSTAVAKPVLPHYPMRIATTQMARPVETPIVVFGTTRPIAIETSKITDQLVNTELGDRPVLIFRDRATGRIRAFDRTYDDMVSRFVANPSTRRAAKNVFMLDVQTNSGWTTAGAAVDGHREIIGQKLTPITDIEEDLYYGVMKEWYPELELVEP